MALDQNTIDHVIDQLSSFGEVSIKKMFGGCGLYHESGIMFGLITAKGQFMLRVGDANRAEFEAKGAQPFNHEKKGKGMPYYEVPVDVFEDRDELANWANSALDVAVAAKKK